MVTAIYDGHISCFRSAYWVLGSPTSPKVKADFEGAETNKRSSCWRRKIYVNDGNFVGVIVAILEPGPKVVTRYE